MKIILLYPKWTQEYGAFDSFAKKASVWPPLNLAYLAAIAENLGHDVKIIDGEAEDISLEKMVELTATFNPDIIGITATTPFYHIVVDLAKELKKEVNEIPIIIGGPHITVLKEKAFFPCFDYAFIGEADESWSLFLKLHESGKDISAVKGLLFRDGENIVFTGDAYPVVDFDSIPPPSRHLLQMDKYTIGTPEGTKKFTTIMSVRGCPFKCIFCSTKVFGSRIRKRSPRLVVDEMKSIIDEYGIKHFMFLDDTLTLDKNHILTICDLIDEEKLDITFEGSTRANLVDEEVISRMAKAGLIRLSFGLESVDENIRKIMRKEVPLESYIMANKLTNKYSIETLNSCMIGLPGETLDTVKKTLSFLRDSHEIKQANISIAVPYPGTELYEMAKRGDYGLKLVVDDFSEFRRYNSAVMYVGDLSPEELIKIQNDAFASIYLAPWRLIPMLRKSGFTGVYLTFTRLIKSILKGRFEMLLIDKNYWKKNRNN
ncbi:MAG: radical SAM protein [Candidatus Methanoperedens sp.]